MSSVSPLINVMSGAILYAPLFCRWGSFFLFSDRVTGVVGFFQFLRFFQRSAARAKKSHCCPSYKTVLLAQLETLEIAFRVFNFNWNRPPKAGSSPLFLLFRRPLRNQQGVCSTCQHGPFEFCYDSMILLLCGRDGWRCSFGRAHSLNC